MRISDILKQNNKGVSFEFFPPKTEKMKKSLSIILQALKQYRPLYASMTCGAGGVTQDRTKEAVYMLLKEKDLVVMPHLTCIGAQRADIKSLLDEYKENAIENIMALRGDPPGSESNFDTSTVLSINPEQTPASYPEQTRRVKPGEVERVDSSRQEFSYAKDLVSFIKKYGGFCIGVAVYPEGHIETNSLDEDMEYTKQKVDSGADFAVSQMFFDNSYYYALLDRMQKKSINIPVLPGILPLTNIAKVKEFSSVCRTTIPKNIEEKMRNLSDSPQDMEKAGVDFTIKQCQDLIRNGIKRLHFFTLNKPLVIKSILDAVL